MSAFQIFQLTIFHTTPCERHLSICKPNLQKTKHRYRTYATCLILCCSSVTRSVITGSSVIMNCQGSVKISEDVTIFLWWEFVFWSFDLVPEAHCSLPVGGSGLKNYHFQQDDALQWLQKCSVLAGDQSEDLAQVVGQCCKSLQKGQWFWPFCMLLKTPPTKYGRVVSHRDDRDSWLDWKRNCVNTSDFIVLAAK